MSLVKITLVVSSVVAALASVDVQSDLSSLLQGSVQEMTAKSRAGEVEIEPPNTYNLPDTECVTKKAPPTAPTSFAEHFQSVRLTPEAETGDPAGASTLRAMLEIAIVAIVCDSMRRWRLQQQDTKKEKAVDTVKDTKSIAQAAWVEMVNAASNGDEAKFEKVLVRSPSVAQSDAWGCTALHFAAAGGSSIIAKELLRKGAEVDALDASEETPLHFAARAGHASIVEVLLDAGAKIDAVNVQDLTALVIAGQANKEPACRLLADRGAGVAGMEDEQLPPLVVSQLVRKVFENCVGASS